LENKTTPPPDDFSSRCAADVAMLEHHGEFEFPGMPDLRMKGKTKGKKPLADALKDAFAQRLEQIAFGVREKEYLFIANYDDLPLVEGWLCAADDDEEWVSLDDNGDVYRGEEAPEPWRGLPEFIAQKITYVCGMHSLEG
jgi:hypothetical protein